MRHITVIAFVICLSLSVLPLAAAQVAEAAQTAVGGAVGGAVPGASQAVISGGVVSLGGQPLTGAVVQARNLVTGAVSGSSSTVTAGQFALSVNPGSYVVEIVDAGGQIVGTSSFVSVAAGATVTTTTVTATSSALGVVSSATGLAGVLGSTVAAPAVSAAAATAGVVGVVAPPAAPTASPSR